MEKDIRKIEAIIEGLLFAAGERISLDKISEIIEMDKKTTKLILNNMILNYQSASRGIMIREINNGYVFSTKPEYYDFVKKLFESRQKQALSQAAYETLSIIAYNQPITKARIETIRGVNSDRAVTRLLERNLIKEAGRMETPGKPVLLETTEEFLKSFGFKSLSDLPILEMNNTVLSESEEQSN